MRNLYLILSLFVCALLIVACENQDSELKATMHRLTKTGMAEPLGNVTFAKSDNGMLEMVVTMTGVPHGQHGIHIHVGTSCGPNGPDGKIDRGLAAMGHYDPSGTGKHLGPGDDGHKGDLPAVYSDESGNIDEVFLVEKFNMNDVRGRAIIIHDGGDNYSDTPNPLGGGGGRYACGILE